MTKKWTIVEENRLMNLYHNDIDVEVIAAQLGRTVNAVNNRIGKLKKKWVVEEQPSEVIEEDEVDEVPIELEPMKRRLHLRVRTLEDIGGSGDEEDG